MAIIGAMQAKLRAVDKAFLEAKNDAERDRVKAQANAILEEVLPKLSPQVRPLIEVAVKVVRPMQADSAAYAAVTAKFFGSADGDVRTIKTRADIAVRVAEIERLDAMNTKLLERVNGMETELETFLQNAGVAEKDRRDFLAGWRRTRDLGRARALRDIGTKIFAQWKEALRLLDKQWGRWHSDGMAPLAWDNEDAQNQLATIMKEIEALRIQQDKVERALQPLK